GSTTTISCALDHALSTDSKKWREHYIRKRSSNDETHHTAANLARMRSSRGGTVARDRFSLARWQRTFACARVVVRACFAGHDAVRPWTRPVRHPLSDSFAPHSARGGSREFARHGRSELPGIAAQSARRTLPARRFQWRSRGHDDRARLLRRKRMEPAHARLCGRTRSDISCVSPRARARGHDTRTPDPGRRDRHDVSLVGHRLHHDPDGCDAYSLVHVLAA